MDRILLVVGFLLDWVILSTCLLRDYHFVHESLSWGEAQKYCRQKYADLATIQNDGELKRLMDTVSSTGHKSSFWIGLNHKINWRWSDSFNGSGSDYRKWETSDSEPDFSSVSQFCVCVGDNAGWWDDHCTIRYPFICYNGTQQNPELVLVNQAMNWADAQSYCRDNFMDLATVRSDAENQKIQNRVPLGNWAWIGLFRDPDFYWSDGSSFIFENWDGGFNRLYSMRFICGISSLSGRWKFVACETRIPFVCYSYPKKRQVVKLRLKVEGSVDLKDPNVKADLLKKLQDRLQENGVGGVTLKWKEQPDGEIFHKEKKREKNEL